MKENNKINISIEKKPRRITKTNNIISNDSISEKNEESSNSILKNNALQSGNMLKKKNNKIGSFEKSRCVKYFHKKIQKTNLRC